jgi:uncharacterized membrane protein YeiH
MNVHELALASLNDHRLFIALDLAGTLAFALSGAVAARDRGLDWFGVVVIAFTVACGGGVLRDLCIGAVPGMVTAVGGGVMRDLLLNRVPVILQREIYALAALVGASIEVTGERLGWVSNWRTWVALGACFALRYLSLHYKWNLPRAPGSQENGR